MQAALCNVAPSYFAYSQSPSNGFPSLGSPSSSVSIATRRPVRTAAAVKAASISYDEISTVDYSSPFSVFPAEACETIGGEACLADVYPEARIEPRATKVNVVIRSKESVERDYLDYASAKT